MLGEDESLVKVLLRKQKAIVPVGSLKGMVEESAHSIIWSLYKLRLETLKSWTGAIGKQRSRGAKETGDPGPHRASEEVFYR